MNPLPWLGGFDIPLVDYLVVMAAAGSIVFILIITRPQPRLLASAIAWGILAQIFTADGYRLFIEQYPVPDWYGVFLGAIFPLAITGWIVYGFARGPAIREVIRKYVFEPPSLLERRKKLEAEAAKAIEDNKDNDVFVGVDGEHLLLPSEFPMKGVPSALEKQYDYIKDNHPELVERMEKVKETR